MHEISSSSAILCRLEKGLKAGNSKGMAAYYRGLTILIYWDRLKHVYIGKLKPSWFNLEYNVTIYWVKGYKSMTKVLG